MMEDRPEDRKTERERIVCKRKRKERKYDSRGKDKEEEKPERTK